MNTIRFNLGNLVSLVLLFQAACSNQITEPAYSTKIPDITTPAPVQTIQTAIENSPQSITPTPTSAAITPVQPTHYVMDVELDYDAKTLTVSQTITYTNGTGRPIETLPILVPPAEREGVFLLSTIQTIPNGVEIQTDPNQSRINLVFDPALKPEESIVILLEFQLRLPLSYNAMGYTERQVRLTDWYPQVPPFQEDLGWLIHPPGLVGEHLVYTLSDFKLNFCLPPGRDDLIVAASAPVAETSQDCRQYNVQNRRNISLVISPFYQEATAASDLVTVVAYTFPGQASLGQRAADLAVQAWSTFTDLYGPNGRNFLTIVEADIYDGLETDGLILLSEWYFQTADPSPQNYFELLLVHETAHQWFYAYIHNDQASEPWLDEALATYSEILYYEYHYPQLVNWWWDFRVNTYAPTGPVNASIYTFNHDRPYINAVYLQGASFLQALRTEVGDTAFFQGLHRYVQFTQTVDQFRSSDDFFSAFSQVSEADLTTIIEEFFQ